MTIKLGRKSLNHAPYYIDPTRHIAVIGGSGVGKTSLLEYLFVSFIRQGYGGLFLDPHGDASDRLPLLIPKNRTRDVIWLDPDALAIPSFNPLYFQDRDQLELSKESCISILKALSGADTAWGNETPHNVRNGLDAVCELIPAPTLVHLFRFVIDDDFRNSILSKSENPFVKLFQKQLNQLSKKDQAGKLAPAVNKIAKLMRPNILPIIAQEKSLDPLALMNSGKIIICRLSKGRLGDETAQILYSFIVSMFSIAALKREKQTRRPPFMIVADEAQNAIHGGRFGTLLAEARKYGISLVTAFQGSYQVPFMSDILTNAGTQIVFNSAGTDAQLFADNWLNEKVIAPQITDLSRYEFYARTFEKNQPIVSKVFAPDQLKARPTDKEKIVNQSLMRYSASKENVRNKILQQLAN